MKTTSGHRCVVLNLQDFIKKIIQIQHFLRQKPIFKYTISKTVNRDTISKTVNRDTPTYNYVSPYRSLEVVNQTGLRSYSFLSNS